MKPAPRKPDFVLRALHKKTDLKATVGAAWRNDDGSIAIVLNGLVNLFQDGSLLLTLFPKDAVPTEKGEAP